MEFGLNNEEIPVIPQESWESIFNSIEAPLMILDDKHRIVRINENMKLKMDIPGNPIGKKCYTVVHGTEYPPEICPHSQTIKSNLQCTEEVEIPELKSWLLVTTSPITNFEGDLIGSAHIAQDITKLKETEEKIQKSLELNDLLMKETHHRVKNNLVTMSSLLYLQSEHVEDQTAKDILLDSKNRARAMAIIHQKLYSHKSLESINLYYYFNQLLDEVLKSYAITDRIHYNLNVNDIILDSDTALILGLIINELVSNSLKYAFPDDAKGNVTVNLEESNGEYVLIISDNGKALPDDIDIDNIDSFGLTIVNLLVNQIKGKISVENVGGTTFTINFKKSHQL
jgi:two-component sensor histidine kinase